jgi:uncharacterized membrane protein
MINFLIYFYYFFWDYNKGTNSFNQTFNAYIAVTAILLINIITLWNFSSTFFGVPHLSHFVSFNSGYVFNKIFALLLVSPLLLMVFIYYKMNSNKVDEILNTFENESSTERSKNRLKVWVYFFSSVLLLFSSFFIR